MQQGFNKYWWKEVVREGAGEMERLREKEKGKKISVYIQQVTVNSFVGGDGGGSAL